MYINILITYPIIEGREGGRERRERERRRERQREHSYYKNVVVMVYKVHRSTTFNMQVIIMNGTYGGQHTFSYKHIVTYQWGNK